MLDLVQTFYFLLLKIKTLNRRNNTSYLEVSSRFGVPSLCHSTALKQVQLPQKLNNHCSAQDSTPLPSRKWTAFLQQTVCPGNQLHSIHPIPQNLKSTLQTSDFRCLVVVRMTSHHFHSSPLPVQSVDTVGWLPQDPAVHRDHYPKGRNSALPLLCTILALHRLQLRHWTTDPDLLMRLEHKCVTGN